MVTSAMDLPDFSIVIPSRNRPRLVLEAVRSAAAQAHPNIEIIVVDDGSEPEFAQAYASLTCDHGERVRLAHLIATPEGHGPSYAINHGARIARGRFLCFLDDDDTWTDPLHLERAWRTLSPREGQSQIYIANQRAFTGDTEVARDLWLAPLRHTLSQLPPPTADGVFPVSVPVLLANGDFPHLNTLVVERELFTQIGGLDPHIRYECEWDLYFRLLDAASAIWYFPGYVSRHNVPDKTVSANVSTSLPVLRKLAFRLQVMDKAILSCRSPEIRREALQRKTVTLKQLTDTLSAGGRDAEALHYARSALAGSAGPKWRIYTMFLWSRYSIQKWMGLSLGRSVRKRVEMPTRTPTP